MLRKKKKVLYRLELTTEEARLLRKIMLDFRNRVLAEGGPIEDINEVILKLS